MLGKKLVDEINVQIKHELYSAYLYLSMASYLESINLPGFAHWMKEQAGEEQEHAMKFYEYLYDRGARVVLQALEQPPVDFGSPFDVFSAVLEHEQKVTARIHGLYKLALQENDYACQVFLQWFVAEQVEEEKNASQIIETLKLVGDKGQALIMLDHELGQR